LIHGVAPLVMDSPLLLFADISFMTNLRPIFYTPYNLSRLFFLLPCVLIFPRHM
jgi:hypothetical protein